MSCQTPQLCSDNTCLAYQQHCSCTCCELHLGDRILHKTKNKYGYIFDVNPLKSHSAMTVIYDDNTKEKLFGMNHMKLEKVDAPRDLTKIHQKYI